MKEKNEKKTRIEQVALSEASTQKISSWLAQSSSLDLSRKEIVNWLIERHSEELSATDLSDLVNRFYSHEKFLQQLLRKSKSKPASEQVTSPLAQEEY